MRLLCAALLIAFTATGLLFAETEQGSPKLRHIITLIYRDGYLINLGEEDLLRVEVVSPFYCYIGDIPKEMMANVSHIKTKFTVQFTIRQLMGAYEVMKQTFIPVIEREGPDVGLDMQAYLEKNTLKVIVTSQKDINDIFIEILQDIPVKISNDRVRYILSNVGVDGQNLERGPTAQFKLYLLQNEEFYKVPVQVTYVYCGASYERVFFFSFRRRDFKDEE